LVAFVLKRENVDITTTFWEMEEKGRIERSRKTTKGKQFIQQLII
jgi:hypothetical protein